MDIVWEKPPEEAMEVVRKGPYTDIVQALKEHPGQWARVPRTFTSADSAKNAATNMRRGIGSFAPKGAFEAVSHETTIWARFVEKPDGPDKGSKNDSDKDTDKGTDADEGGSGSTDMLANEGHDQKREPTPHTDPELAQRVRAWAKEQGYEVAERGRMSRHVFDAYFTHHPQEKRPAHLRVV